MKTLLTQEISPSVVSDHLAFGLQHHRIGLSLATFAEKFGAKTYKEFTSGGLQPTEVLAAIKNPNNTLHFNLSEMSTITAFVRGPKGPSLGNVTNWELHSIFDTPGAIDRTTFYQFEMKKGIFETAPTPRRP